MTSALAGRWSKMEVPWSKHNSRSVTLLDSCLMSDPVSDSFLGPLNCRTLHKSFTFRPSRIVFTTRPSVSSCFTRFGFESQLCYHLTGCVERYDWLLVKALQNIGTLSFLLPSSSVSPCNKACCEKKKKKTDRMNNYTKKPSAVLMSLFFMSRTLLM